MNEGQFQRGCRQAVRDWMTFNVSTLDKMYERHFRVMSTMKTDYGRSFFEGWFAVTNKVLEAYEIGRQPMRCIGLLVTSYTPEAIRRRSLV